MPLTALIDDLSFQHNGLVTEFTWAWDTAARELTLGGFRLYDGTLSYVDVYFTTLADPVTVVYSRIIVTDLMDSNDIRDAILAYLTGAITDLTYEVVSETPARTQASWQMDISWLDVFGETSTLTPSTDGDCEFSVNDSNGEPVEVPLGIISGIAASRGRLLAWGKDNTINRSAILDPFDFTPSLATQASIGQVEAVRGNILMLAGIPDGYLIYSTDNVVLGTYTGNEYVFQYTEIRDIGINSPMHVYHESNVPVMLSGGNLYAFSLASKTFEAITPTIDHYLMQQPWPIRVLMLEDRYLAIGLTGIAYLDREARRHRGLAVAENVYIAPVEERQRITSAGLVIIPYTEYARFAIFDTKLSKWGSCDTPVKILFNTNFVNASGIRMDKAIPVNSVVPPQGDTLGIGMVTTDNKVSFATRHNPNSFLAVGHTKARERGYTSLLEVYLESVLAGDYDVVIEPFDESMELLDTEIETTSGLGAPVSRVYSDRTAVYFNVLIKGVFHLREAKVTLLPHGRV